jgi:antirestriction protein ArdC
MNSQTERRDVYSTVTDRIIAELEQGVRPWIKPWNASNARNRIRPLRHNGTPYRGINVLMLWIEAVSRDYVSPLWMTFKQAVELGGHVRKGEHGTLVVYADRFTKTDTDDNGEAIEREIPFMKGYTVFNTAQIEGLSTQYYPVPAAPSEPIPVIEKAEKFFAAIGADIRSDPNRAAYLPSMDCVLMPPRQTFISSEAYYDTLGHEHIHLTGHPGRLNRDLKGRFGTEAYAAEELIAEMGVAFLCADLGISAEVRPDHASYLAAWLKVLRDDKRAIFTAAAHAQRAVDYLHTLQPQGGPA